MSNLAEIDLSGIIEAAKATKEQIQKAKVSALRLSSKQAEKMAVKLLSDRFKIPQKNIRKGRGKRVFFSLRDSNDQINDYAKVWIGYSPLKSSFVGRKGSFVQMKKGVRAGKHFFEGSFLIQKNNWVGSYKRVYNTRYPIKIDYVEIELTKQDIDQIVSKTEQNLKKNFIHELNFVTGNFKR